MGVSSTSARATLDALSDPVIVIGPDGAVQLVNAAAVALLGEPGAELLGRPVERLFPRRIAEADGADVLAWLRSKVTGSERPARVPLLRHDGVEIHQVMQVTTTSTQELGPVTILTLRPPGRYPEDTELDPLHSDAVEPTPESIYEAVFESVPVGVLHFDATGRITACNEVFVQQMGSSRAVLTGLDMCTLPNGGVVAAVKEALAGGVGRFEGEYVSATGGRRRMYRATFSPILRGGRVEGGVGIVDDITERKSIEARLAQGERMASLGRLAAGVAHEINNPLAYVRTSLDIARRRLASYRESLDSELLDGVEDGLRRAYEGVDRVRIISSDLKTFSRGDDGSWLPVSLEKVIDSAINLTAPRIRGVAELSRDLERAPPVMGSETRFVQVVVNLLVNAAQAIEQAPEDHHRITVRLHSEGSKVVIDVVDTGLGMPAERLSHVFEPFWTSKPKGTGVGLGLAICHGIVTSAGGDIRVLRSSPSEGTTMRVELPAAPERTTSAQTRPEEGPPEIAPSRARVLVIDDELRLAKTIALGLGDRYDVETVDNGARALEVLRTAEEPYDLVLCDLMMPEMSGMELYETLVEERPELAKSFVFMTGGAFTDRAREFLGGHSLRRLEKPFALEDVERLLGGLVEA